ncbi:MAG: 3-oxoacyl-ACP synthase [Bacteroidota bacterium]
MIDQSGRSIYYLHCMSLLEIKSRQLRESIDAVQVAANSETKSTAGDKHETARAMAQLDIEMLSRQLAEVNKSIESLKRLSSPTPNDFVQPGSLVQTSIGAFYLSVGLGAIEVEGEKVMAVSSESPIAKAILGKKSGDCIIWNGTDLCLVSVVN